MDLDLIGLDDYEEFAKEIKYWREVIRLYCLQDFCGSQKLIFVELRNFLFWEKEGK